MPLFLLVIMFPILKKFVNLQDSSNAGANVTRLNAESAASVTSIEKSVLDQKREVKLLLIVADELNFSGLDHNPD